MSANFEIKINNIRTTTVDGMNYVIKRVEFTVKGTESSQTFELPQVVELPDPKPEEFKPLDQITEAIVIKWVEDNFENMEAVKAHIQYVLDKEVAKASLAETAMPWTPVPEPVAEPTPAP